MKIIEDRKLMPWNDISVPRLLDNHIKTVEINCPVCKNGITFTEVYINRQQEEKVNYMIDRLNSLMKDIDDAILEIYGEDIRLALLQKRMSKLKEDYFSPKLEIIKGGK